MKSIFKLVLISTVLLNLIFAQNNELVVELNKYIQEQVDQNLFSGSVLISKNNEKLINKGYGLANHSFNIKNSPSTKFRIASLTKGFTAVAILQLVEKNLITLDDKISKYLPDFPDGNKITITNLLNHTSGIANHTEFEDFDTVRRFNSFELIKTIDIIKKRNLNFEPNSKFEYSNSNYLILGYIIEQITQIPYSEYIGKEIFQKTNMKNSGFEEPEIIVSNFATGYCNNENQLTKAKYRNMANAHASGALYSTTEDLFLWDRALKNHSLINSELTDKMFTSEKNYGFGWGIVNIFNRKMIGHNGQIDGFNSNISRFVEDDVCIIILSNFENTPIGKMSFDIAKILFNVQSNLSDTQEKPLVTDKILEKYAGKYELKPNFIFHITTKDGRIFCQPTGQAKLEIFPNSKTEFYLKEVGAKINFVQNSDGNCDKLVFHQGSHKLTANKISE